MAEKKVEVADIVTLCGVNVGSGQPAWPKHTLKKAVPIEFARILISSGRARVATPEELKNGVTKPAPKAESKPAKKD